MHSLTLRTFRIRPRHAGIVAVVVVLVDLCCRSVWAQDVPWVQAQMRGCLDCTITNIHFWSETEGWASARLASTDVFLLHTEDGGLTWDTERVTQETYGIHARADFLDPLEGWATADAYTQLGGIDYSLREDGHNPGEDNALAAPVRLHWTANGGRSWSIVEGPVTETAQFGDVTIAQQASRRYLSRVRFVTRDVGVVVGLIARPAPWNRAAWVFSGYVILATRDGGDSWKAHVYGEISDSPEPGWDPAPVEHIASVGMAHIWVPARMTLASLLFRTVDGGRSWDVTAVPGIRDGLGSRVQFRSPTNGWSSGGASGVQRTRDGGLSWAPDDSLPCSAITFYRDEGWCGAYPGPSPASAGIYRTTDGGTTWSLEFALVGANSLRMTAGLPESVIWAYGPWGRLMRRAPNTTSVRFTGQLPIRWGSLKQLHGADVEDNAE